MAKKERAANIEQEMATIDRYLQRLKKFETDRPHGQADAVDDALEMVIQGFNTHPDWRPPGTLILLHGSMQYHDWHRLDIDLSWIALQSSRKVKTAINLFETSFNGILGWPGPVACETNVGESPLIEIRNGASNYSNSPEQQEEKDNISALDASIILSGKLLLNTPEQQQLHRASKEFVRNLAKQYPGFRQGIIHELKLTLQERESRRKELGIRRNKPMNTSSQ